MRRRGLLSLLILSTGGYVVARQRNLLDPIQFPGEAVGRVFGNLPQELQIVLVLLFVVLGFVVGLWVLVKVGYRVLTLAAKLHAKSGSSSPLVVFAVAFGCMLAIFFGATWFLIGDTPSMWESESGATGLASELEEAGMASSLSDALDGDTLGPERLTNGDSRCSKPTGVDSDGDRLPDTWEQRGSTPGGAPLPGADPNRKDLYIQPIYETGAERFTDDEKQQLRRVWAEMPVRNPGEETGIEVHVVDQLPNQGRVDDAISISSDLQTVRNQYYTQEMMGAGFCRYHLVAFGSVSGDSIAGYGETPGFVSAVDATRIQAYEGSVTFRVAVTTHELLHNTAGNVNGNAHPGTGWLGADGEYLGTETEQALDDGFAPPRAYWG